MNKKLILSVSAILLMSPVVIFAQTPIIFPSVPLIVNPVNFYQLVLNIAALVLNIIWIIGVAFVVVEFVLAGFKFMTARGDASKVAEARNAVIWGTVGIAVILLAWTMLAAMRLTLGI